MNSYGDRVKDTTTTTGTGPFTVSGNPPEGYQPISAIGGVGATFIYGVSSGALWEIGVGTITALNTVSRAPSSSSNGGALVDFPEGADFFCTLSAAQIAKFNSSDSIAFATAIPLTMRGAAYMPQQAVASVLPFTIAPNPVQGALVYLRLVANGTHVPTFASMKEWGGSLGYDNRNGIANQVQFFYDGVDFWYSISQAVNASPDAVTATAITLSGPTSGVVNVSSSNFTVGTNGSRSGSVIVTPTPVAGLTFAPSSVTLPAGTATASFTATSTTTGAKTIAVTNNASLANPSSIPHTVASAAVAPGAPTIGTATAGDGTVSVPFTAPASNGGSAITGYTATLYKVSDNTAAGSATGTSSPIPVTATNGTAVYAKVKATNAVDTGAESAASNSVTPAAAVLRLRAGFTALTESPSAPYSYTGTAGGFDGAPGGVFSVGRQAAADGSMSMTRAVGAAASMHMLGVVVGVSPVNFTSMPYLIYNDSSGNYSPMTGGAVQTPANAVTTAVGDIVRLRFSGTNLIAEVSKNSGSSWTMLFTWADVPETAFNFQLVLNGTGTAGSFATVGLA